MPNYQNGKIYKLVSDFTDEIYIGSTTQKLCVRFAEHKRRKHNLASKVASQKLFELGDVKIILIEECPCDNKEQLLKRERHHIENNKCLNIQIPGRTDKEWREVNKNILALKNKKWREDNKENQKIKRKIRVESNPDFYKEVSKKCYEKHKEKRLEDKKEYYKKIKEKRQEKITCECGSIVSKGCLTRHKKRQIHQSYLSNK